MFLIAIAFLVGHCCLHILPALPPIWPWSAAVAGGVVASVCVRRAWLTAGLLGFAWAWLHAGVRLADQLPAVEKPQDALVRGYVASLVDASSSDVRFDFDVIDADSRVPSHIRLRWYDTRQRPLPGELWQLHVRLRGPRGFADPGVSDYAARLFRDGVGATGYVRENAHERGDNRRLAAAGWRYLVLQVRQRLDDSIRSVLGDSPMLGIVQGLSVGDTAQVSAAQWRVFSATGTTHLLAISGLHIGMVAALVAWWCGVIARRLPLQRRRVAIGDLQAAAGTLAAVLYAALAGFSLPTQRTLVMVVVYFGTRVARRQVRPTHGLGVALIGVLLIDPFAPLAPGFWLSFGAVTVIFFAGTGRLIRESSAREYMRIQAVISIGLLPFLVGAFGSISLVSPLVNLLAIPVFTFVIVPLTLLGTTVLCVSQSIGAVILQGAAQLLTWAWPAFVWCAHLPLATWHVPQLPLLVAVVFVAGCMCLIGPVPAGARIAGAVLCFVGIFWRPARVGDGAFRLATLDVGQGLAVVVATRAHTLVYDAGPSFRSGRDTGEMVVLPYLQFRGVRSLDMLMISHGDADHVGGAASLLDRIPTEQIVVGPSVQHAQLGSSAPRQLRRCRAGETWTWDGVRFTVLAPTVQPEGILDSDNNSSCVLRIVGTGGSAILMGDIEREGEAALLASNPVGRTDVVVVPHHGSRTSSTRALVDALHPLDALVSAGFGNRWGFPKTDVMARWQNVGASAFCTAASGALEVTVTARGPTQVHAFRVEHPHYWQRR